MPTEPQNLLVYVIVAAIIGGFVWSWIRHRRSRKSPGCGADCGCEQGVQRNPVIQKVVEQQQAGSDDKQG